MKTASAARKPGTDHPIAVPPRAKAALLGGAGSHAAGSHAKHWLNPAFAMPALPCLPGAKRVL